MIFTATSLAGAYLVDLNAVEDERGFFARSYCAEEFAAQGLASTCNQCNVSFNSRRGTLRGLHYQAAPHEEDKLVRCTAGAIFDVMVDIRAESPTYLQWFGAELTADNRRALYIPRGLAHGFVSLADDTEVFYMMSAPFVAGFDRGIRWNDPAIGIRWPVEPTVVSARDTAYPWLGSTAGR